MNRFVRFMILPLWKHIVIYITVSTIVVGSWLGFGLWQIPFSGALIGYFLAIQLILLASKIFRSKSWRYDPDLDDPAVGNELDEALKRATDALDHLSGKRKIFTVGSPEYEEHLRRSRK